MEFVCTLHLQAQPRELGFPAFCRAVFPTSNHGSARSCAETGRSIILRALNGEMKKDWLSWEIKSARWVIGRSVHERRRSNAGRPGGDVPRRQQRPRVRGDADGSKRR